LEKTEPHNGSNSAADFAAAIKAHENYVLRRPKGKRADLRFVKAPGISQANLLPLDLKSGVSLPTKFDDAVLDRGNFHEAQGILVAA
jgi:hypothetical protein